MLDLGKLEEQLNTDSAAREAFQRDPVGVLRKMGVLLSTDQQSDLRRQVAQLNIPSTGVPLTPLARPRPGGNVGNKDGRVVIAIIAILIGL